MYKFEEFVHETKRGLESQMGDGYQIFTQQAIKNNGIKQTHLIAGKNGETTLPVFHLEKGYGRYLDGLGFDEWLEEIRQLVERGAGDERLPDLGDFDAWCRENVLAKVVNYEKNKDFLVGIPHERVLDLAITFHVLLDRHAGGMRTFTVTNGLLRTWGIGEGELRECAISNTERIFPCQTVIRKFHPRHGLMA